MNKIKNFMKKIMSFMTLIKNYILEYVYTNRIFLSFVVLSLIMTVIVRGITLGNADFLQPMIVDLALLLLIGSFGYFFKPNKQFSYFFVWMIIISAICVVNSIYFTFFYSFASFSLLETLSQVGEVQGSLVERLKMMDFVFVLFPLFFYYIHRMVNTTNYYSMVTKVEKGKRLFANTLIVSTVLISSVVVTLEPKDFSRISTQWNKDYVVSEFGIILYQGNDLVQSLTPKISTLFGYEEAVIRFTEYFEEVFTSNEGTDLTNKYTGILEGKNVIFVHMESIQTFLVDMEVNGVEITPTLNRVAEEGMYFSDFHAQISSGTSSDTEFTLNTSLMPALSGIVNINYVNRNYISTPKLLSEKGYYIFSTHGNKSDMWNRNNMHPSLGYDDFFAMEDYEVTDENILGLGISDQAFYQQFYPKLLEIDNTYNNYMGTVITLTNHSPFFDDEDPNFDLFFTYGDLDLTNTYQGVDEDGLPIEVVDDYLEDTNLGNYLHSAHYADMALGEFIEVIENDSNLKDTVFVFYGDHEAKLSKSEFEYYYNYNEETGTVYEEEDPNYVDFDYYKHELNKTTPLVIWTADEELRSKLNVEVTDIMGVIDVMPTIGNMMGFNNPFALGHDIFEIGSDNVVVFPNGNFATNYVYYKNSDSTHYMRQEGGIIESDYIDNLIDYTDDLLHVSYDIILHDLIDKEGDKLLGIDEDVE